LIREHKLAGKTKWEMLRASAQDTSLSMFGGLLQDKDMNVALSLAESNRQSLNGLDNVAAGRFPFAIQHLLGIDAVRRHHHHHHHQQQQQQQQSPIATDIASLASDDVTHSSAWTGAPCHVTGSSSDVTWYTRNSTEAAMMLDDVIARRYQSSSLSTLTSHHRRFTAASLTNLPGSPTSLLPASTADNVSGKQTAKALH